MNAFNTDYERISDFGCRKILGMNRPVSHYINGCQKTPNDCFVSSKKMSPTARILANVGGIALALGGLVAFVKKKIFHK